MDVMKSTNAHELNALHRWSTKSLRVRIDASVMLFVLFPRVSKFNPYNKRTIHAVVSVNYSNDS